jgi:Na+/citrate or Na+/malate symporter
MPSTTTIPDANPDRPAPAPFWPNGWWKIVDARIGIVPLPIFLVLLALIAGFAATGSVPSDILMAIVLLSMGGFACAELGKRIPIIRNIGAAAIFATFIPSFLAFHHLLPQSVLNSITQFTKDSNFLYLFISCIIVGSILGMDRGVLIKGFLKIFVPLAAGSVVGSIVGTLVGVLLGLGAYHTFFFIVVPIMAGGVGEGAIPLSIGYSQILGQPQGDLFAQVLPPVMLGSLTAILLAGTLNFVGKRSSPATGRGRRAATLGAFHVYKFFSTVVTYPLLFAIGVSLTPWDKLVAAFNLPYVLIIVSTVVSITATGYVVGGWLKMYPIDTAIVTACHSGQGGTGDVAILTAANRMQLMPFAQIATRIGGAITVTLVLIGLTQIA